MRANVANVAAVFAAIEAGDLCDTGHYYCPEPTGSGYKFPSGAILRRDGAFAGPAALAAQLAAIPADYRPEPVAVCDRYPPLNNGREQERRCYPR